MTIQIDLEGIMLQEISQKEEDTYDLSYIWNLKEIKSTKLTDTENRLVIARVGEQGIGEIGEGDQKVKRHKKRNSILETYLKAHLCGPS